MKSIYKVLFLALILRLVVSLLGQHGDVVDFYWWTRDLVFNGFQGFYDRIIANAVRPNYPPVTSYLFWAVGSLHELLLKFAWFLNLNVPLFPSNFIFWMESNKGWYFFNKLPAILSDVGITYILYRFVRDLKGEKSGILAASLFAFVPAFWYNSSFWGQTESVFALPLLCSFYFLYKRKIKTSIIFYALAILTKPTALFPLPIFIYWILRIGKLKDVLLGVLFSIFTALILYFPFHPSDLISWIVAFYLNNLHGVLGYIVANAFNIWSLVFGFDNRPDTSLLMGVPVNVIGYSLYAISIILTCIFLRKKRVNIDLVLLSAVIISFSAFMFLPRMHERYFYPALILMVPLAACNKNIRNAFWVVSTIHLINLYHFWWAPRVSLLISIFSNAIVEKIVIIFNISVFIYLITIFRKVYAKAK